MRHVVYFLGLSLGVVALGCSSSATTTTVIVRPELVAVSPDDVLGVLPSANAAQVQSYVATLFDVTPDTEGGVPSPGFQLASSPPTSVKLPVTFSFVVTSHRYLAVVDVYTQLTQAEAEAEAAAAAAADAGTDAGTDADAGAQLFIAPSTPGGRLQFDPNGTLAAPLSGVTCGGYPATPGDGGSYGGAGSMGEMVPANAGAAGAAEAGTTDFPPGILTYDGITQTAHNCVRNQPPGTTTN